MCVCVLSCARVCPSVPLPFLGLCRPLHFSPIFVSPSRPSHTLTDDFYTLAISINRCDVAAVSTVRRTLSISRGDFDSLQCPVSLSPLSVSLSVSLSGSPGSGRVPSGHSSSTLFPLSSSLSGSFNQSLPASDGPPAPLSLLARRLSSPSLLRPLCVALSPCTTEVSSLSLPPPDQGRNGTGGEPHPHPAPPLVNLGFLVTTLLPSVVLPHLCSSHRLPPYPRRPAPRSRREGGPSRQTSHHGSGSSTS